MRLTRLLPLLLFVLFVLACNLSSFDTTIYTVEYVVDGSAREASVTYTNQDGGTEQQDVILLWSKTIKVRRGAFLYISAQNKNEYGGLSAKIKVNGVVVKTATSVGAYHIASVSDRCCP